MAHQHSFTPEEIQHYTANPNEVDATNIYLLEALALANGEPSTLLGEKTEGEENGSETTTAEEGKAVVEDAAQAAAGDKPAEAKAEVPAKAETKGAEVPEGAAVATPDGKHTIPYKVLNDERKGRQVAEQALAETQQQLLSMSERLKALEEGRDPGNGEAVTEDDLAGLEEKIEAEAPWLKETFGKLANAVRTVSTRMAELDAAEQQSEEQQVDRLKSAAHEARDRNPTLVLWESQAPELFAEAVEMDAFLRNSSHAQRFRTFDDRFAKAVDLVKANHAGEDLPLPQAAAASAQPVIEPKPSAQDVKARAAAALAKAAEAPIGTISDIPGGTPPTDPIGNLERTDQMTLLDALGRKTPNEILEFVRGGGR